MIFLIEDDQDDQYMFKMILAELGFDYDLVCFENGLEAYEFLTKATFSESSDQKTQPDIILLDLNLPVWDGKKTLSVLKKDLRFQAIPIIIYTTSKSEHDITECYSLGANSYISKAAEYDLLQIQIKTICRYWFNTVLL